MQPSLPDDRPAEDHNRLPVSRDSDQLFALGHRMLPADASKVAGSSRILELLITSSCTGDMSPLPVQSPDNLTW